MQRAWSSTPSTQAVNKEIKGDGLALFPSLVHRPGPERPDDPAAGCAGASLADRFETLEALPQLRALLLDTDPEFMRLQYRSGRHRGRDPAGHSEVLLTAKLASAEPLPQAGRWSAASLTNRWFVNPCTLYRIPRSQVPSGVRALGRLAFCDNYPTIVRRLQVELDACTDSNALTTAGRQTGLGVRSNRPLARLHRLPLAWPMGGTGGGMFLDLAYARKAPPAQGHWVTSNRTWLACCCCPPWMAIAPG